MRFTILLFQCGHSIQNAECGLQCCCSNAVIQSHASNAVCNTVIQSHASNAVCNTSRTSRASNAVCNTAACSHSISCFRTALAHQYHASSAVCNTAGCSHSMLFTKLLAILLLPNPSSVDHCHGLHSCERTQRKDLISTTCILDEVFPKLRLLSCTIENALEMCMASSTKARAPCWSEPAATPTPVWLSSIRSRADRHCGMMLQHKACVFA